MNKTRKFILTRFWNSQSVFDGELKLMDRNLFLFKIVELF